jgi:hypothetical protein
VVNAPIPPSITTQPASQTVSAGGNVTFSVTAGGTAPIYYQWTFNNNNLAGQTGTALQLNAVTVAQAGNYAVVVTNFGGAVTSSVAVLSVGVAAAPTIVTQPQSLSVVAGSNATFSVVASGSAPLSYQWTFGTNVLPGQTGTTLSLLNVTAPQAGDYAVVISNSIGSVTSAVARLTIRPSAPGTDPRAPWRGFAGRYNGLLYDTNGVALGSSGFFSFNLTPRGTYSALIQLSGGWRVSTSGSLKPDGTATNAIPRRNSSEILVSWAVDLTGSDQITGYLSTVSGAWSAELLGDRALFNARTNRCPYAGRYTLDLAGTPGGSTNYPAGDGYASVTIDGNGNVTLHGLLPDKTPVAQKVALSKAGSWPLFAPLYSGTGALIAWVQFENRANDDFNGLATWLKPNLPTAKYYPGGFSVQSQIVGSLYSAAATGSGVLQLTNGIALFVGDPMGSVTNAVHLVSAVEIAGADPRTLKATFKPTTGLFTGSYLPPGGTTPVSFSGALSQKVNVASGFFLDVNQSGLVRLQNNPGQ